ncbi:MAG: RNA polymerase sigma factor (TIGR02999 family) [Candidatus Paceibacteria bacterium]
MVDATRREVTQLLLAVNRGEENAWSQLLPIVYDELLAIGRSRMRGMADGQTLQATALVHEAYLRLLHEGQDGWENRSHFYSAAARSMRNILVDAIRSKGRDKRGGIWRRVVLDDSLTGAGGASFDLLGLDEALEKLEQLDRVQHKIVMLRYFAGLKMEEVALAAGVSLATCERHWNFARAWLFRELSSGDENQA